MAPLSRKLLQHGPPAAVVAGGVALLAAGGPAALAWTLIVLSLAWAASGGDAVAPSSGRPGDERTHNGRHDEAMQQRHAAESRRTRSGPR